jgi:hypothetical protein
MSVQCAAVASQKVTDPPVTGVEPETTVAVRVTTLPEATEETGAPLEVTVSVVVVAPGAAHAGSAAISSAHRRARNEAGPTERRRVVDWRGEEDNANCRDTEARLEGISVDCEGMDSPIAGTTGTDR